MAIAVLSACFVLSYWFSLLFPIAWLLSLILITAFFVDLFLLYNTNNGFSATRSLPKKLSNSDINHVKIDFSNHYPFAAEITIIDELPWQFQKRDFSYTSKCLPNEKQSFEYQVRPVDRGEYTFGYLNLFATSPLRMVKRRFIFQQNQMVPVYPSILQMQQYDFFATHNKRSTMGLKKIRKIGHTQEFEQIKDYVMGDDMRTLNWKATAKRNQLMVNQYQDEKSQPVYTIIDTGRAMKMPFNNLKLLDYAINSALAFSNIALKRKDKTGLLTFSKKITSYLPASQKTSYLNTILENLYRVDTQFTDSDFGALYGHVKRKITQRSLLLLYTNFEHISALERQLPYLLAMAKKHVLVVIFFENSELESCIDTDAKTLQEVYHKTIAEKFSLEKKRIQKELQRYGIQTVLSKPESLTINTINKYLEIKARGLL